MDITLWPDLTEYVRIKVASGEFRTADEVINQAVFHMMADDDSEMWPEEFSDRVRRAVSEGDADIAAGRVGTFDLLENAKIWRRNLEQQTFSKGPPPCNESRSF